MRSESEGRPLACPLPALTTPLHVVVSIYAEGKLVGMGRSTQDEPCAALREATRKALDLSGLARAQLARARFTVDFTHHDFALVEFEGKGVELVKGKVPVRSLDKPAIERHIAQSSAYLLRMIDRARGGVHKYYHAPTDAFDERLHTIYTASTVYTLIALHRREPDERLREPIERAAGFLLAMQRIAPGQPGHGAFHYSLDLRHDAREPLFVVGTTAKSIFALIELHAFTGERRYLDAARLAGEWLMTMQHADGSVTAKLEPDVEGSLTATEQDSTLYTGQLLSALSRLSLATNEPRYLEAAARTAGYLIAKRAESGCYVGDDYREPNPVSSSWLILSLLDFAKAGGDATIRETALACADELLARQIDAPQDVDRHGRWSGSLSSSGNGWLAEVLALLYLDCPDRSADRCLRYRDAAVRLVRIAMQHTYTPQNAFVTKNPAMARGGLFWNARERDVRTDSVCHALNAYVYLIDHLPDGPLLELPEPELARMLENQP